MGLSGADHLRIYGLEAVEEFEQWGISGITR